MRYLIKTISLILAVTFLMSGITFAADTDVETDYIGYVQLENMFRGIGVLTDGDTFTSDYLKNITEDEMNTMISNLIGSEYTETSDGEFNFNKAVKKVIDLLGYDVVAAERGPYPGGYMKVAQETELLEALTMKGEKPISVGEGMRLLFNAMHINIVDRTVYGDEAKYQIVNETLLLLYKKLYFKRGILTDNSITDFDGESKLDKGEIKIDGELYITDGKDYSDLIGRVIGAYYRIESNQKVIVYADDEFTRYNTAKVWARDILAYSNYSLAYTSNDTAKILNLTPSAIVIYNNISAENYLDSMFKPKSGYVELIDNDLDGVYEVAVIKSYENMIISSINTGDFAVRDMNDSSKDLSLEDREDEYIIKTTSGDVVGFEYLKEYDVLSVAKAENDAFYEIIVSNKFASGDVTSVFFGDGEKKVKFNDREYYVDPEYTTAQAEIAAGMYGTALRDFEGDIVFFADESGDTRYGYIIDATEKKDVFETKLLLKLLTQDDEIITYECDEEVTLNGAEDKGITDLKSVLFEGNKAKQQLIKYRVDSEEKICLIDTPMDVTATAPAYTADEPYDKNHLRLFSKSVNGIYYKAASSIGAKLMLNSQTRLFVVAPGGSTDEDKFQVLSRSSMSNANNQGTYDAYCEDQDCISADVLITTSAIIGSGTSLYMIDEVGQTLDEDGKLTKIIYATLNEKKHEIIVDRNYLNSVNVQAGDIARIRICANGLADSSRVVYRKGNSFASEGTYNSNYYVVSGNIYNHKNGILQITQKPSTELSIMTKPSDSLYFIESTLTYLWNEETQKFEKISSSEIYDFKNDGQPDSVVIFSDTGVPKLTVVYR